MDDKRREHLERIKQNRKNRSASGGPVSAPSSRDPSPAAAPAEEQPRRSPEYEQPVAPQSQQPAPERLPPKRFPNTQNSQQSEHQQEPSGNATPRSARGSAIRESVSEADRQTPTTSRSPDETPRKTSGRKRPPNGKRRTPRKKTPAGSADRSGTDGNTSGGMQSPGVTPIASQPTSDASPASRSRAPRESSPQQQERSQQEQLHQPQPGPSSGAAVSLADSAAMAEQEPPAPRDISEFLLGARMAFSTFREHPGLMYPPGVHRPAKEVAPPPAAPFHLTTALESLVAGDWFMKWTRKRDEVHRRFFWLDTRTFTLLWAEKADTSSMFTRKLDLARAVGVRRAMDQDESGKTIHVITLLHEERVPLQLGTELREKYELWSRALSELITELRGEHIHH